MNILSKIGLGTVLVGIVFLTTNAVQSPKQLSGPASDAVLENPTPTQNIYALEIPEDLNFAGEPMPVNDPDIRERIDRELLVNTYWQSNMLILIKRSHKYFPIIEALLKKYGLPDDFKYLAVAESGLDNVKSPAGAAGFWQFLNTTGKEYGLEVNDYVDERYHLEKATKVAAAYLKNSKEKFGSWTAAAAAYNAGNGGVLNQMKRQEVGDYYNLLLNNETSRYVFRIVAIKEIMSNPKKYGFHFEPEDVYKTIPTYKVKVDSSVTNFAAFAKNFGINYKILKIHNPWLRETYLKNASKKEYIIEIPEKGYYKTIE
ncbi:MAG: lytic transglycosylase domain-containing protein [Flavobacteriaceae bacterium]